MAHKLGIVPFTGLGNWGNTRPAQGWQPFGGANGAKGDDPTYWAKHRDGSQTQIYNDLGSSEIKDENPKGIWTSANSTNGYSHTVLHKVAHSTFVQLGWDSNSSISAIKNADNLAPITNFSGMSFQWDRRESFWSDSAINIDSVYFTIFDGEADKVWQQKAELSTYTGLNPQLNGDKDATGNRVYYKTSNEDWNWCSNKKRYLIGITIQFFQKKEGSASHSRTFRIYNLQPIYGHSAIVNGAQQVQMSTTTYGAINSAANGGRNRLYLAA